MKLLISAILKVMEEVNGVAKNMTVGEGKNSYKAVSDKDVKETIRESMIKNKLVILPIGVSPRIQIDRWEEDDTYNKQPPYPKKTKQSVFTEVDTKYILVHQSGESIELAGYGQGVDTQDKGAGKATTYALKNTLLNMFLVPTGVDTDDTHSNDLPVPPKQAPKTDTPKKWLNYDIALDYIEAGNTTPDKFKKTVLEDGYSISQAGGEAMKHYFDTGELVKDMFFKK